jgi:VanZ family protein
LQRFTPALLWAAIIFALSTFGSVNPPDLVPNLLEPDKLAHAVAYFLLASLVTWGFLGNGFTFRQAVLYSFFGSVGYGILMELIQYHFFPNRFFEKWDIVANTIGCLLSVGVAYFLFGNRKIKT